MTTTVYQIITDRILAKLEEGIIPWRKPWTSEAGEPQNLFSRREYRGINVFMLGMSGFSSPFWMTYRQAQAYGANVRKGEKSTPVVFWKFLDTTDKTTGEKKQIPLLRYYNVFNLEQVENMPEKHIPTVSSSPREFSPIEAAAKLVDSMPQRPTIRHGSTGAFYRPSEDFVSMPRPVEFNTPEEYYSTLFHELAHSTGHASRLDRPEVSGNNSGFGSHSYGREELLAEMTAAFLCATAGIENTTIDNSAAYLQSWMKTIKADTKLLVIAASGAQKAADFILNRSAVPVETADE